MDKEILKTLRYFAFFSYAPSFEEIFSYLESETTKESLKNGLQALINSKKIVVSRQDNLPRYTVGEYSTILKEQKSKVQNPN